MRNSLSINTSKNLNPSIGLGLNPSHNLSLTPNMGWGSSQEIPRVITRYGGKGRIWGLYTPIIKKIARVSGCSTFIDLFGGGGTAAFGAGMMRDNTGEPLFKRVIYNEIEKSVVKAYEVVKDPVKCMMLIQKLLATPYSEAVFNTACTFLDHYNSGDFEWNVENDIVVAWAEIVRNRLSYNGAGNNFRDYTSYDWKGRFVDFHKQFQGAAHKLVDASKMLQNIEIRQGDYSVTLSEFKDEQKAFFFIDPPYLDVERAEGATNVYRNEFTKKDHIKLLQRLSDCQHWMLCGYRGIAEPDGKGKCRDTGKASEIYGFIDNIPGVQLIDLGKVWKPSSGKTMAENGSHEFIWVRA